MLETILEQYPKSSVVNNAYLVLGKHYMSTHEQMKAIGYFNHLKTLDGNEAALAGEQREMYLESTYLTGVAYFQVHQYGMAFPILRKITNNYPNTVWANQAYYYIGMCHFTQQNWSKAIEALSLVGTFVDPGSATVQYVEAGRRFYVKIQDADLPVLANLGKQVTVAVETAHGDKETIECVPLVAGGDAFIGSIPTEIGTAKPGDHVLQVIGGDAITTKYTDENDENGKANVVRTNTVKVVSTAQLNFTQGDYESKAPAAFLDQPIFVELQDVDLDTTDAADTTTIKIVSRYKETEQEVEAAAAAGKGVDVQSVLDDSEKKFKIRDQVTLKLTELAAAGGGPVVHTGRFGGRVPVEAFRPDKQIDPNDQVLTAAVDDEIVATYVDEVNIGGATPRTVESRLHVIGEIDNRPRATQDVVFDPVVKSRKDIVEATAFLELARIFKSMGLVKGAKEKAAEGLDRVDYIVRTSSPIPSSIKEDAFKLKWELHLVCDDFASAMATCNLFNRLYPDSPFVDEALMGIANIRQENRQYYEALAVYQQVLNLPKSQAKGEAQYKIAQITEATTSPGSEQAVQQYKLCAERYPESEFAGAALAKLVDYDLETKDYAQANQLLEQIFQDHPDAGFLDGMLLKWVLVAFRMGDYQKAHDKCSQLLFEYPESSYAAKAKQILPKIEARLKKGSEKGGE